MGLALRGVEVGRRIRQVDVVYRHEQEVGPIAALVPRHLHVLRAAQRHLRQQLLQLGAELLRLGRELPVHVVGLAHRLGGALFRQLPDDLALDRPVCREQLLDRPRREVHADFRQHRMHDPRRALELRAARGVVPQPRPPDALLVLLVALLARLAVAANQVQIGRCQRLQVALGQRLGKISQKLAV